MPRASSELARRRYLPDEQPSASTGIEPGVRLKAWTRFLGTRSDWFIVTASACVAAAMAAAGGAVLGAVLPHEDVATWAICLGIGCFIAMLLMSHQVIDEHRHRYEELVELEHHEPPTRAPLAPRATHHGSPAAPGHPLAPTPQRQEGRRVRSVAIFGAAVLVFVLLAIGSWGLLAATVFAAVLVWCTRTSPQR